MRTKKIIPVVIAVAVTGVFLVSGSSCPATGERIQEQNTASRNYQKYCAGCHGANLEKFAAKDWMDEEGTASVFRSIKSGIEMIGMPSFEKTFSTSEIEDLAAYVKKGIPENRDNLRPAVTPGGIIESEVQKFVVDTVVKGLNVPWGLAFLPDGRMLITERAGTLHIFSDGKLSPPVGGVPEVMAIGQGGLLDVCLHPDYEKNGWIYFSYSYLNNTGRKPVGNTAIMRARLKGNSLADQQIIYKDNKGHIFFGNGDRGQHFDFPQKLDNTNGKIHRLNDDGTIPADNPFVNTPGAIKSIYSYGHRNPQGTCIDPLTGELWISEHGPRGGDELNLIKPGLNYGWPVICYGINYDGTMLTPLSEKEGMEQPVFYWLPSIGPCGMTFVTGERYKNWKNNIMLGSLPLKHLERVVFKNDRVLHREPLLEGIGRVRNVVMSPDGYIYLAIETPGAIMRLIPIE
jgi:glucose/arabinose dehydrogenase